MGNRRVLIAGGGVGAVEAALALRALAGTRVSIELISPYDELVYRPLAVAEPFGDSPAPRLAFARLRRTHSVEHVRDIVDAVDVRGRRVRLEDRGWLPFDDLVIAIGARTRGWLTGSLVFRGAADVCAYRHLLDRVAGGEVRSLVFAAPEGASWPLPLYELALLTAGWIADRHVADMDLHLVTGEPEPLGVFGPTAARVVRDVLGDRGVRLHAGVHIESMQPGSARLRGGRALPADAVVTLPLLFGDPPRGLPADRDGFLLVDAAGAVADAPGVWAIGDAAAHRVKHGGLATQQADAVAARIAAAAGAPVPLPEPPELRGVLLTGVASAYLRARVDDSTSNVSFTPAWSDGAKVAARHLVPYMAEEGQPQGEREALRRTALALAQADADGGDHESAMHWRRTAEWLAGVPDPITPR